jgi:hypothetical protein
MLRYGMATETPMVLWYRRLIHGYGGETPVCEVCMKLENRVALITGGGKI